MKEKELTIYINGEYLPRSKARIDPLDYGWRRGWVVYDAWVVRKGYIMALDGHTERLWNSLRAAKIEMQMSKLEAKDVLLETVRRNGLKDAEVWMYVSYGVPIEKGYNMPRAKPTVMVIAAPMPGFVSEDAGKKGVKVIISSVRSLPSQCLDPRLKHVNRLHMNLADVEAQAAGADAPILLDINGYVTENNFSNVFVVKDGKLYTPTLEGALGGITRGFFFQIARREGIPASETRLTPYDLYNADEVFLSGSSSGALPVAEIGGRKIGDGTPGPMTLKLNKIYWDSFENPEFGTPVYP
jgi:branched-chain amino acid aminotransferase